MSWTSSNSADASFPVTGCQPVVTFTTTGTRTITLTATEPNGKKGIATVSITVSNPPSGPPLVTILNPKNGAQLDPNQSVSLQGVATDPDGKSPISYQWVVKSGTGTGETIIGTASGVSGAAFTFQWKPSSQFGAFGCGSKLGQIILRATDPDGMIGSASIEVVIFYPPC